MERAGLRELRQKASELVRRAENGETVIVTVSGRDVAELKPIGESCWRQWDDISDIFAGPADPDWAADSAGVDQTPRDPFDR